MSAFRKIMCRAGLHSGQWSNPGSRCETVRVCDNCGCTDEKSRHTWGLFEYVNSDECDQVRRCRRCGSSESRQEHNWGPWLYLNTEFNSPQVHTCRRCLQTEKTAYTLR